MLKTPQQSQKILNRKRHQFNKEPYTKKMIHQINRGMLGDEVAGGSLGDVGGFTRRERAVPCLGMAV